MGEFGPLSWEAKQKASEAVDSVDSGRKELMALREKIQQLEEKIVESLGREPSREELLKIQDIVKQSFQQAERAEQDLAQAALRD